MLADVVRFNRLAHRDRRAQWRDAELDEPIGDFLDRHALRRCLSRGLLLANDQLHLVLSGGTDAALSDRHDDPLLPQPWVDPVEQPAAVAHGPRWLEANYVQQASSRASIDDAPGLATPVRSIAAGCHRRMGNGRRCAVDTDARRANDSMRSCSPCHSDQALALLCRRQVPTSARCSAPSGTTPIAPCCTPTRSVLPQRPRAWAAWNYERTADHGARTRTPAVCLHYLINRLQPLPWKHASRWCRLNPAAADSRPTAVLGQVGSTAHPVFDRAAIAGPTTGRLRMQGRSHVWFCGAWTRYGFHEDGLMSGLAVVDGLRARWQPRQTVEQQRERPGPSQR